MFFSEHTLSMFAFTIARTRDPHVTAVLAILGAGFGYWLAAENIGFRYPFLFCILAFGFGAAGWILWSVGWGAVLAVAGTGSILMAAWVVKFFRSGHGRNTVDM